MLTELANGANATAVDQPGLPGESLHLKTGNGGDYHGGEGVGGNGGVVKITLGRGGNGWEESAAAGQLLVEDADGNPLLWIKNGEITGYSLPSGWVFVTEPLEHPDHLYGATTNG